ncbi:MAG: hypothetical protein BroJett013_09960 [Alphaproteobacteria bacterium]|nr:MAG: hypothetical protein BroJett013_09960 [Alphaproteobacteria bacterium]
MSRVIGGARLGGLLRLALPIDAAVLFGGGDLDFAQERLQRRTRRLALSTSTRGSRLEEKLVCRTDHYNQTACIGLGAKCEGALTPTLSVGATDGLNIPALRSLNAKSGFIDKR